MKLSLWYRVILLIALTGVQSLVFAEKLELHAMSFNVRWDGLDEGKNAWENRRPVAIEMIKTVAPDIVGLQEPSPAQTQDLDIGLVDYLSFQAEHVRDQHITLLYRSDRFSLLEGGSFWLVEESGLSGGTRRCVWIRLLDKETRLAFYVFNCHLDHRSVESRTQSVNALIQGIENRTHADPFILTGDFNAVEKGAAIQSLLSAEIKTLSGEPPEAFPLKLADTFRRKYPEIEGISTGHGFSGKTMGRRIDYIFVRNADKILDAQIIRYHLNDLYPSDHYPVTAKVQLVYE